MKMANSITATRITGRETDWNTTVMIRKIATMDTALTTLKSLSVMVIRSLVQGASPISIPELSYFLMMEFRISHCSLTSSVATLYSDWTRINCQSPCLSFSVTSAGMKSLGTAGPRMLSKPRANLTPATSDISFSMALASFDGSFAPARTMCVAFMSNSSASFSLA